VFHIAIYHTGDLITILDVGHPCLMDFIKKVPKEYKIQIIGYDSVTKE
jgi:hypothetical protein